MQRKLLLFLLLAPFAAAQQGSLGTVDFQTSCTSEVRSDFNHAVALLHSFEYDEARPQFEAVLKKDPHCAMAEWGVAMTYFHGLWGEYNPNGGSKAAAEARRIADANASTTRREKQYIAAISEIYTDRAIHATETEANKPDARGYREPDGQAERAYADKMAELHRDFPDDDEAAIFYALSLDIAADPKDKTHAAEKQCTSLLDPLMAKYPNHPGVAHYLVHCNDNAAMASAGLPAARVYAKIAPSSAHATHMPSHIFAELGLWDEMIASNRASIKAAGADKDASACQRIDNTLHSMHFLTFALLQVGQKRQAQEIVDQAKALDRDVAPGECRHLSSLVTAVYALESHDWASANQIDVHSAEGYNGSFELEVAGVAAARQGDDARAAQAEEAIAKLRDVGGHHASHDSYSEVSRLVVAAFRLQAHGDKAKAEAMLRDAVEMQERMGAHATVITPPRELLADVLLENGKTSEALHEYEAVLQMHPHRFNALYGAGSAAFAEGNKTLAGKYYRQLMEMAPNSDRKELAVARERAGSEVASQ